MRNACSVALLLALAACGPNGCQEKAQVVYKSIEDCKKEKPAEECEQAFARAQEEHVKTAPRYNSFDSCTATYGAGACTVHHDAGGGGDFFLPFMTGIIAGHALSSPSYTPQPMYMVPGGAVYSGANRVGTYNPNSSGRTPFIINKPPPAAVPSRGGFGSATQAPAPSVAAPTSPATGASRGGFGSSVSSAPTASAPTVTTAPSGSVSTGVARSGFGGSAASAGASSSGG